MNFVKMAYTTQQLYNIKELDGMTSSLKRRNSKLEVGSYYLTPSSRISKGSSTLNGSYLMRPILYITIDS